MDSAAAGEGRKWLWEQAERRPPAAGEKGQEMTARLVSLLSKTERTRSPPPLPPSKAARYSSCTVQRSDHTPDLVSGLRSRQQAPAARAIQVVKMLNGEMQP